MLPCIWENREAEPNPGRVGGGWGVGGENLEYAGVLKKEHVKTTGVD